MHQALYAKTDAALVDRAQYLAIWRAAAAQGLKPREWWLVLGAVDEYPGDIVWPGAAKNQLPDLASTPHAFARWMRRYLQEDAAAPGSPRRYMTGSVSLDRIRMINLYIQIKETNTQSAPCPDHVRVLD